MPAIQSARGTALRAQCANNLKQIALAAHNYHSANDAFAPGDIDGWPGWSAQARLLPFLEQGSLFNAINFSFGHRIPYGSPWGAPARTEINATVTATRIAVFLCPSSPPPAGTLRFEPSLVSRPGNSYFASMGPSLHFRGELARAQPAGLFINEGPLIGLRNASDGSSTTILFGEWRIGDCDPNRLSPQDVIAMGDLGPNGEVNGWDADTMTMPRGDANGAFRKWLNTIPPATKASVGDPARNKSWLSGFALR